MSKWLRIAQIIASSTRNRLRFRLGSVDSFSGSTHDKLRVSESVAYCNEVFEDFVNFGQLSPENLQGRRILELGPGDNVGVALRFLACGAREIACLDKFYSTHDLEHERQIYKALRERLSEQERRNFDAAVKLEGKLEFNPEKLRYVYGVGVQDAKTVLRGQVFDLIVSRGVLQEVYEIDRAFEAMDRLLADGGTLLHKIDLRDYGMFSEKGFHPREFWTIPEPVYKLMAYDTDKPNRRPLQYYRDKVREMGYEAQLYITAVIEPKGYRGVQPEIAGRKTELKFGTDYFDEHRELIRQIRPRLTKQFQGLSDDDLLAGAVFLVATKRKSASRSDRSR